MIPTPDKMSLEELTLIAGICLEHRVEEGDRHAVPRMTAEYVRAVVQDMVDGGHDPDHHLKHCLVKWNNEGRLLDEAMRNLVEALAQDVTGACAILAADEDE